MDKLDFQEHQKELLTRLLEVGKTKQAEYANAEDAFHNFNDGVGISMHESREALAWEYCTKHLQSVRDIIKHVDLGGVNGHPTQGLIDEKFGDIIVYMTLLHGMLTDKINKQDE